MKHLHIYIVSIILLSINAYMWYTVVERQDEQDYVLTTCVDTGLVMTSTDDTKTYEMYDCNEVLDNSTEHLSNTMEYAARIRSK